MSSSKKCQKCGHPNPEFEIAVSQSAKNPGKKYKKCSMAGCGAFLGWAGFHERDEDEGSQQTFKRQKISSPPSDSVEQQEEMIMLLKKVERGQREMMDYLKKQRKDEKGEILLQ